MHFSAFVVTAAPANVARVIRDLEALPGVEVRHYHQDSGRLVVIHEGETLELQQEALLRIQSNPQVLAAGLFYHYEDPDLEEDQPGGTGTDSRWREQR